jgi:hypothetical protein
MIKQLLKGKDQEIELMQQNQTDLQNQVEKL